LRLAAGANLDELVGQIGRTSRKLCRFGDAQKADELAAAASRKGNCGTCDSSWSRGECWPSGRTQRRRFVVSAAVGVVGLEATYEAVKLGRTIALSKQGSAGGGGRTGDGCGDEGQGKSFCLWIANTTPCTSACGRANARK